MPLKIQTTWKQSSLEEAIRILDTPFALRQDRDCEILMKLTENVKFFKEISERDPTAHYECCHYLYYLYLEKDDTLFEQGSVGKTFYIILEGSVRVIRTDFKHKTELFKSGPNLKDLDQLDSSLLQEAYEKVRTEIKVMYSGESFGELALMHSAPRAATIVAKDITHLACLDKEHYDKILGILDSKKKEEEFKFYKAIPYLKNFSPNLIERLHLQTNKIKLMRNEHVYFEGDISNEVFFVHSGEVKLAKTIEYNPNQNIVEDSRDIFPINDPSELKISPRKKLIIDLALLGPGQIFGEDDIEFQRNRFANAICVSSEVEILRIHSKEFARRVTSIDEYARNFIKSQIFNKQILYNKRIEQVLSTHSQNQHFLTQVSNNKPFKFLIQSHIYPISKSIESEKMTASDVLTQNNNTESTQHSISPSRKATIMDTNNNMDYVKKEKAIFHKLYTDQDLPSDNPNIIKKLKIMNQINNTNKRLHVKRKSYLVNRVMPIKSNEMKQSNVFDNISKENDKPARMEEPIKTTEYTNDGEYFKYIFTRSKSNHFNQEEPIKRLGRIGSEEDPDDAILRSHRLIVPRNNHHSGNTTEKKWSLSPEVDNKGECINNSNRRKCVSEKRKWIDLNDEMAKPEDIHKKIIRNHSCDNRNRELTKIHTNIGFNPSNSQNNHHLSNMNIKKQKEYLIIPNSSLNIMNRLKDLNRDLNQSQIVKPKLLHKVRSLSALSNSNQPQLGYNLNDSKIKLIKSIKKGAVFKKSQNKKFPMEGNHLDTENCHNSNQNDLNLHLLLQNCQHPLKYSNSLSIHENLYKINMESCLSSERKIRPSTPIHPIFKTEISRYMIYSEDKIRKQYQQPMCYNETICYGHQIKPSRKSSVQLFKEKKNSVHNKLETNENATRAKNTKRNSINLGENNSFFIQDKQVQQILTSSQLELKNRQEPLKIRFFSEKKLRPKGQSGP